MSLKDKAMLVTLSVSCWTNRKLDRVVSAEVERAHNARNAGNYNKTLVDEAHLRPVTSFAASIRQYHYKLTLPWMDNGARMLPSKLFMEYSKEMRRLKIDYQTVVDGFLRNYDPRLIQEARQRLGTMYDPEDYPPASELRGKFGVDLDIQPVPDGADFRVDVGDGERARIQQEITERVAQRARAAEADAIARVREGLTLVHARLTAEKVIVRDSLIENMQTVTKVLAGANIYGNPVMEKVCQEITENLIVDPERLRKSVTTRKRVAEKAQELLTLIPA